MGVGHLLAGAAYGVVRRLFGIRAYMGGGAVGLGMFSVVGGSRGRLREYCIWGFVPGAGVIGGLVTGVGNRSSACWSGIGACGHIAPVLGLFWHGGETRMVR